MRSLPLAPQRGARLLLLAAARAGRLNKLKTLGSRPTSPIHAAADAHVARLSVALRYAFARGRRVVKGMPDPDAVASVVGEALAEVLEPMLRRVVAAGGEAGARLLVQQLRAAGFDPDQPRDEGGKWTSGGGGGSITDKAGKKYDVSFNELTRTYTVSEPGSPRGVSVGSATMKRNFTAVMSVGVHTEHQRKGIATALYKHIETHLGRKLVPNWALTPEGEALWKSRGAESHLEIRATSHKFASTQVNLPPDLAAQFASFPIDPDDLISREDNPHITVKYGLVDATAADVADALRDEFQLHATLGEVATFEGVEGGTADAVIVEVRSECLRRANRKVAAAVETVDTHPEYIPHATIAYVKPGRGKKYAGDGTFAGDRVTFDTVTFCPREGEQVPIYLGLRAAAFDPDQPRDEDGQWTAGGGKGGGVTKRPDGVPVQQRPVEGSLAERRNIKVGNRVSYHYRSPGDDMGKNGSGEVVGFVSNRGRDRGSIQDVVIRDGDSIRFVAEKNVRLSLRRVKALAEPPLKMRFDATNPRVVAWAKQHAAELVTNVTATTRDRIRLAIEELQEEGDVDLAHDRILYAVGDEARATLIARHETMLASHEGQRAAWDQAVEEGLLTGRERRTWVAVGDGLEPEGKTCPICDDLDGKRADLGGVYLDSDGNEYNGPPAHVQCRCTEGIA